MSFSACGKWGGAVKALVAGVLVISIAACDSSVIARDEVVKNVTTFTIANPEQTGLRHLPARLEASRRSDLSFRVSGKLKELNVREGDEVVAGQVLAKLDQADFRTVLTDKQAAFIRSRDDFERAKKLIVDDAISVKDYDQVRAAFRGAKAQFEQAKVDLAYTELKAPFDGQVALRVVENFEQIQAGEKIFHVIDVSRMDVKFDVPESLMILVRGGGTGPRPDEVVITAVLPDRPDQRYPMDYKEAASKADPKTKTFEVTYQMDQLDGITLLPGMTAMVNVEMLSLVENLYLVPTRVVFGDITMQPNVWVLDEATMTVSSKPVVIGRMAGAAIAILEGVAPDDVLISSPVSFLREGEKVMLASRVEQGLQE